MPGIEHSMGVTQAGARWVEVAATVRIMAGL